jgi:enamine deaminase RidA (YjgF/YER057c/UK114 family)
VLILVFSGSVGRRPRISGNADFQSAVPQISQLLENLQSTKQHLNQLWGVKKMRLEQCLQLRIFEEDVEKVQHISIAINGTIITKLFKLPHRNVFFTL